MKRLFPLLLFLTPALLFADITGDGNPNYSATGTQTQGLYYPGGAWDQPLIGAKVSLSGDQRFWRLFATLSEQTDPATLSDFKLWKSTVAGFSPARATQLTGVTPTVNGRQIAFDFWQDGSGPNVILKPGETLWVTARIAENALPQAEIDISLSEIHVNGMRCMIQNESPEGAGMVYEFDRHVVPYYRAAFVHSWNDRYYDLVSEVIFFELCATSDGRLVHGWSGGVQFTDDTFTERLNVLRDGRGDRPVRILMGIAHCKEALSEATQNATTRALLVDNIIACVEKFGFDGVDIDWEYPESAADWRGFDALVTELRPRLFALGGGKMLSSAMSLYKFNEALSQGISSAELQGMHQQLDMLNLMTYDSASADGHSPMWLHNQGKTVATETVGMPKMKTNVGLPFYTNTHTNGQLTWEQYGYAWVCDNYPDYIQSTDIIPFNDGSGKFYSFNSIATIRTKGADLMASGFGAMIWAYETDVAFDDARSLARTLATVITPKTDALTGEITSASDWGMMLQGHYTLKNDITLTAEDLRPTGFGGTIDGNGKTITLTGGGALINGSLTGTLKNLTVIVQGPIAANGILAQNLITNGALENVHVRLLAESSLTGTHSVGTLVGEIYTATAEATAQIRDCSAEIAGTLTVSGNGRIGGLVGNLNQGVASDTIRIRSSSSTLFSGAKLIAQEGSTYPGIGAIAGNCNVGSEKIADCSAVIYDNVTFSGSQRIGALFGGNTWGSTLTGLSGNWLIRKTDAPEFTLTGVEQVLEFSIGSPDPLTQTAAVTFTDPETNRFYRLRLPVVLTRSGYQFRLR